jgi:hypothetical protein
VKPLPAALAPLDPFAALGAAAAGLADGVADEGKYRLLVFLTGCHQRRVSAEAQWTRWWGGREAACRSRCCSQPCRVINKRQCRITRGGCRAGAAGTPGISNQSHSCPQRSHAFIRHSCSLILTISSDASHRSRVSHAPDTLFPSFNHTSLTRLAVTHHEKRCIPQVQRLTRPQHAVQPSR